MFLFIWILASIISFPVRSEIVCINQGCINGTILHSRNGYSFYAFFGIPYAASPTELLRFQPPSKPPSWLNIRQAVEKPPVCLQYVHSVPGYRKSHYIGSEDCLYVNVFTKEIYPQKLLPVLVYIHGGAFRTGNGITNGPHLFMDKSIVFVSFNHRLGVFGYLSSGDEILPGNYGLKDQVMALKWIQENISVFGGDPKSVTILGHNSGAASVHLHATSPLSKGLFHKMIMQSGNAIKYLKQNSTTKAKKYFLEALTQVNCFKNTSEERLLCLRNISGDYLNIKLNAFLPNNPLQIKYEPVIENSNVRNAFFVGDQFQDLSIPVIIGFNSAEGLNEAINHFRNYENKSLTELNQEFDKELSMMLDSVSMKPESLLNATAVIKKFYFKNALVTKGQEKNVCDLIGDIFRSIRTIDTILKYPGKKYFYIYDYKNTRTPIRELFNITNNLDISGAAHGDEIVSLFSTSVTDKLTAVDRKLSENLIKYWVNFMYTGNPNKNEVVVAEWKPVSTNSLEYLHIAQEQFTMKTKPIETRYKFWKSLSLDL
ncbi:hypothetical protein PGB90_003071 [Kerria lacca]